MQLQILSFLLSAKGFEVIAAQNGYEAFERVQKSLTENEKPFDLVILDLHMPISDGYEACKNICTQFSDVNLFKLKEKAVGMDQDNFQRKKKLFKFLDSNDIKPLMVACSSEVSSEVREQTAKAGFDLTFLMPLSAEVIQTDIIPKLLERKQHIEIKKVLENNDAQDIADSISFCLDSIAKDPSCSFDKFPALPTDD